MKPLGKYGMIWVITAWSALSVGCVAGGGALPGGTHSEGDIKEQSLAQKEDSTDAYPTKRYRRLYEHSRDARERRTIKGAKGMPSGDLQSPQHYHIFEHSHDAREFRYQYE